jgi:hypothetical protein
MEVSCSHGRGAACQSPQWHTRRVRCLPVHLTLCRYSSWPGYTSRFFPTNLVCRRISLCMTRPCTTFSQSCDLLWHHSHTQENQRLAAFCLDLPSGQPMTHDVNYTLCTPFSSEIKTWCRTSMCTHTQKSPTSWSRAFIALVNIYFFAFLLGWAALRLLEDFAQLKQGDVIIHNGANGMVGQVLIQLAAGVLCWILFLSRQIFTLYIMFVRIYFYISILMYLWCVSSENSVQSGTMP